MAVVLLYQIIQYATMAALTYVIDAMHKEIETALTQGRKTYCECDFMDLLQCDCESLEEFTIEQVEIIISTFNKEIEEAAASFLRQHKKGKIYDCHVRNYCWVEPKELVLHLGDKEYDISGVN